jgi:thiol:disulfide interchange protein
MDRRTFILAAAIAGFASTGALALNVKEIEIPGLAKAAAAGKPILVHVTAPWCGTCKIQ